LLTLCWSCAPKASTRNLSVAAESELCCSVDPATFFILVYDQVWAATLFLCLRNKQLFHSLSLRSRTAVVSAFAFKCYCSPLTLSDLAILRHYLCWLHSPFPFTQSRCYHIDLIIFNYALLYVLFFCLIHTNLCPLLFLPYLIIDDLTSGNSTLYPVIPICI
jgi:hypothetical protein